MKVIKCYSHFLIEVTTSRGLRAHMRFIHGFLKVYQERTNERANERMIHFQKEVNKHPEQATHVIIYASVYLFNERLHYISFHVNILCF